MATMIAAISVLSGRAHHIFVQSVFSFKDAKLISALEIARGSGSSQHLPYSLLKYFSCLQAYNSLTQIFGRKQLITKRSMVRDWRPIRSHLPLVGGSEEIRLQHLLSHAQTRALCLAGLIALRAHISPPTTPCPIWRKIVFSFFLFLAELVPEGQRFSRRPPRENHKTLSIICRLCLLFSSLVQARACSSGHSRALLGAGRHVRSHDQRATRRGRDEREREGWWSCFQTGIFREHSIQV